ncbi:hypothetical protein VF14_25725 [Nostoc linckia z18]|uniref:Uncharacterized protein n=2 Tax=Nostoc linckia TaxID=92942 RepID=A0A9Q5Z862_NOSLI|nr:hypothetical protein [Nostoc linckia]PHK39213.1 hypothetical protein VF12_15115 [Nostoc linckia z15]PHK43743.1 hypothetical protein VF13_25565 [Nostoc linckia z16]PHJ62171.1 hypothetical protein VF02_18205 [Nostoc linckia z1]PHJ72002.1 hypothetical protein VF05_05445 [Nostoc linckia z3]PHJ77970.1 hypothetical protein VF03_02710 [Nostoc linckia z2]
MVQLYYSNAEFNAHLSQAEAANSILNAVQSDRLAFMLRMEFRIQESEFRTQNSELRIQESEFRTQNSELRIKCVTRGG